jgi:uncharacterized protein with HEPN domain
MRNEVILHKITGYAEKILRYCENVSDLNAFSSDSMLIESCVFNLSQIGELVRKLDKPFTEAHAEIPWRALYGLRNRIVHDYEGVNIQLVWELITEDLPELVGNLADISQTSPAEGEAM